MQLRTVPTCDAAKSACRNCAATRRGRAAKRVGLSRGKIRDLVVRAAPSRFAPETLALRTEIRRGAVCKPARPMRRRPVGYDL
jgi:hypothetical protein